MKKRKFLKLMGGGMASLVAGPSILGCQSKNETSERISESKVTPGNSKYQLPDHWVWFRPSTETTDDEWKAQFEKIKNAGVNGILPQVYSSRETLFDHPLLPVKERWLERIIPIAHSFDLQVHAWMWTMPLNEPGMIEKHPDWFSVNRYGQPSNTHPAYVDYYKFMCPCNEDVHSFVAGNVEALGKIEDLDGIHLDYVRQPDVILAEGLQPKYDIVQDKEYPEYDYPYSENCRRLFMEQTGIDPMDLGDDAPAHQEWRQFRYDAVSNVVNNHCVPMARKYNKPITAAVFPNWESVRQQWNAWDLDAFLPMLYHGFYNEDIEWIGNEVKKAYQRLESRKNDKPVYSGLFIPHLESGEDFKKAIDVSMSAGAKGISIFALGSLKDVHWDVLEKIKG